MKKPHEACLLVLEMATGPIAGRIEPTRWRKLSLTYRETRLNLNGIPVLVKYQSWLQPAHVTTACERWLEKMEATAP